MNTDSLIKELSAENQQQVAKCFCVFSVLRPHLTEAEFVDSVRVQYQEGYRIAYIEQNEEALAATGYRIAHFLAWGKVLYVDDLITHPMHKRKGLAAQLLDWLEALAIKDGCGAMHLDTGYERHDAHRLYIGKGFRLSCHHLAKSLRQ